MSHSQTVIDTTLHVAAPDEATASRVGEILTRVAVGLSAENVEVWTDVERRVQRCHCDDDHDEAGIEPGGEF